jgi:putative transposase
MTICHIFNASLAFVLSSLMSNYKRLYLDGYSYFITMVTQGRNPILIDNIALLRDSFKRSKQHYDYHIDAIIILPEHIHMIITPKNPHDYSKIITHIKRSFIYGLDKTVKEEAKEKLSSSSYQRKLSGIWQKRFYEHTIRDEKDWLEKMHYIQHNAVKHALVEGWEEWKYSSFT